MKRARKELRFLLERQSLTPVSTLNALDNAGGPHNQYTDMEMVDLLI